MNASKSSRRESDYGAACRCTYFSLSLCTRYARRWGSVPERGDRSEEGRRDGGKESEVVATRGRRRGRESGNEIEVGSEGEVGSPERKGLKGGEGE